MRMFAVSYFGIRISTALPTPGVAVIWKIPSIIFAANRLVHDVGGFEVLTKLGQESNESRIVSNCIEGWVVIYLCRRNTVDCRSQIGEAIDCG
jgi:hypothetical protein